jgi:secondary thiamine-phosphate synthase enzyme
MPIHQAKLEISTQGPGTYEITDRVARELERSGLSAGTVTVFCRHTSCSLVIMENADPTARSDLEEWMDRLVPESNPHFEHTLEGPDDMPSHIKMALTRTSEVIPFGRSQMMLGTWQGIYLWEHRSRPHTRSVIVSIQGE